MRHDVTRRNFCPARLPLAMVGIRHRPSPSGEAGLQWEPVVLVSWFLWLCCGPLVAHLVETLATTLSRALSRALLGGGFGCDGTQWKDLPAFFSAACSRFFEVRKTVSCAAPVVHCGFTKGRKKCVCVCVCVCVYFKRNCVI